MRLRTGEVEKSYDQFGAKYIIDSVLLCFHNICVCLSSIICAVCAAYVQLYPHLSQLLIFYLSERI